MPRPTGSFAECFRGVPDDSYAAGVRSLHSLRDTLASRRQLKEMGAEQLNRGEIYCGFLLPLGTPLP